MTKSSRSKELSEKAQQEQRRCRDWLLHFMQGNQPKFLTKDELRSVAMRELNVSKNSFDFAWIDAIETSGRVDWYEPLRKQPRARKTRRDPTKVVTLLLTSFPRILGPVRCSSAKHERTQYKIGGH